MTQELTVTGQQFDYSGYDQDFIDLCRKTQQLVQKHQEYGRRTIETGLELGNNLIQIKAGMKHGEYQPYLDMIGLRKATAYYWVRKVEEIAELAEQEKFNIKLLEAGVIETTLEIIPDEEYEYSTNADEALANAERIDIGAMLDMSDEERAMLDDLPTTTEPLVVPTHEHQNGFQSNGHQETHPTEPTLIHRRTGNGYHPGGYPTDFNKKTFPMGRVYTSTGASGFTKIGMKILGQPYTFSMPWLTIDQEEQLEDLLRERRIERNKDKP